MKQTQNGNLTSDPPSALVRAGAWGEATLRTIPPPPKARAAEHADIGSLQSEAQRKNEVALWRRAPPRVVVASSVGVCPRVAGSLDDVPRAGSEGAKGAEGDGLVGVVERLGPDDRVVVLVLLRPVLVRSESPLLCRLVVHVSVDQRVGDAHVQDGALARGEEIVADEIALALRPVGGARAELVDGSLLCCLARLPELLQLLLVVQIVLKVV